MPFEILEDMSWADTAFRVKGRTREELFAEACRALWSVMLEKPDDIRPEVRVSFECEAPDIEMLLYDFLLEFLFCKDAKNLILLPRSVSIDAKDGGYRLACNAVGEAIDRSRHRFIVDVKAITMHNFSVASENGTWTATIVVDV